jgi:hypothetical protein
MPHRLLLATGLSLRILNIVNRKVELWNVGQGGQKVFADPEKPRAKIVWQ